MKKFLIGGVSLFAILSANNAMAAGYTCEELIEYTSCNPGYYLTDQDPACPSGFTYRAGVCIDGGGNLHFGVSQSECEDEDWYLGSFDGDICVRSDLVEGDEVTFYEDWSIQPTASATKNCSECPIGSTCAGGTAGTAPCPAGSYCATTGLSQPTGQCAIGTFAGAGSISCTECPDTTLKDINNNIVTATTLSAGATSAAACFINPDAYFKNDKGTYHFKSNCEFDIPTMDEACIAADYPYCNLEDDGYYCESGMMETMVYEPLTGGTACYDSEFPAENVIDGNPLASLASLKEACVTTGGTWDIVNITCKCPSGTQWDLYDAADTGTFNGYQCY